MLYNPLIFREYDIRGVVNKDYDKEFARILGRAFAYLINEKDGKKVTVGRDCRLSSPELHSALVEGMSEAGLEVLDLGVITTPMMYFSLFHLDVDGGIQISGSHNPPDQNGFKVCVGKDTIYGEEIQRLKKIIDAGNFPKGKGSIKSYDINTPYIDYICKNIHLERSIKVVIDAGNGTAGPVAPLILKRLGCELIELFTEMDGNFPNHHPDPTVLANIKTLKETVLKEKAELGIGYDGDADRIGLVDDKAQVIWGDILMIILSRSLLKEVPGATIIAEVKCSHRLFNDIEKNGGKAIMWKAGHSLIKAKMKEENAELGGEMSGHIFFKHRYFGYDDAIYTSARLLELLSKDKRKLSEIIAEIPPAYSTPEIRIQSYDERKFKIVEEVKNIMKKKGLKVIDVDGVRVVFPDGWGLVRASNTQPMLVMRFEAETEERLEEIKSLIEKEVQRLNQ